MALYRDQVVRLTIKQIRASYTPRTFAQMTSVKLQLGIYAAEVEVVRVHRSSCFGGTRLFLRCPRCQAETQVVGCGPDGFGCAGCLRWRSRGGSPEWAAT